MENDASFGYWIRRRRKALDLTQEALAEQVSCSVTTIRKIESDERRPSREMAELLAKVLEIDTQDRALFLKVARAQRSVDQLATLAPVATVAATGSPLPHPIQPTPATTIPPHLPVAATPFVGREVEVQEVSHLLAQTDCRLLTIVGPGGMGKTRLALEVASRRQTDFADGVYFVAFAPLSAVEFMLPTIANTLGISLAATLDPQAQLLDHLRDKHLLLVLDNLEHLLEGVELLSELIRHAADVTVLATSRERLNLQGEWVFDLQGLPVPPLPLSPEGLTHKIAESHARVEHYSSVTLFLKSAQRMQTRFTLSAGDEQHVARICRLVDGMPLGIELAAAWVHLLSCGEIAQEIERSIDFLEVNRRDVPERHRSLRAVFDHSWKLLSAEEQQVITKLTVFRGGFTRDAAQQVVEASLLTLSSLVQKSLLRRSERGGYDLHELVRQYARSRMVGRDDNAAHKDGRVNIYQVERAHALYYLGLVEGLAKSLWGAGQQEGLRQIRDALDNLRSALEWVLASNKDERTEQIEKMLDVCSRLARFWHGQAPAEGRRWLEQALAVEISLEQRVNPAVRALALAVVAWLTRSQGDFEQTDALLIESLSLYRQINDENGEAGTLDTLGDVALARGMADEALTYYEESLMRFRNTGNKARIPMSLCSVGDALFSKGDYARAIETYRESLALSQAAHDERGCALAMYGMGICAAEIEELDKAVAWLQQALTRFAKLDNKLDIVLSLANLANVAWLQQRSDQALCLLGAVDKQSKVLQFIWPTTLLKRYERHLNAARQQLDEARFTTRWSKGQAMTLEEATAYALAPADFA